MTALLASEERSVEIILNHYHIISKVRPTLISRLNQNVEGSPTPCTVRPRAATGTNHDHARGRTEKSSKANAAQEALNYIAEHEPEMQHLFLFQSLAAWERQSFWSAGDR